MIREILILRTDNGRGANDPTFHDIVITDYSYKGTRMGMPELTASLMWPSCLDDEWSGREYVVLRGERFYIRHTPTSSKKNTDERYKHELIFISERNELFGDVYFVDTVYANASTVDKPCSNSFEFKFYGTISEAIDRLNCAFRYAGIGDSILSQGSSVDINTIPKGDGYYAVLDHYGGGDLTKSVEFDFSKNTLWEAMSAFFEKFNIPFEFRGRKIIWNAATVVIDHTFKYGDNNELLSIVKNNANAKIVNRVSMLGSSENILYYYPNETEYGHIVIDVPSTNTYLTPQNIVIENYSKFLYHVRADENIECAVNENRTVFWKVGDKTYDDIQKLGLSLKIASNIYMEGETIKWKTLYTLPFQERLMPPKYRETMGEDRFYNAQYVNLLKDTENAVTIESPTSVNSKYERINLEKPLTVKTGDKFTFSVDDLTFSKGNQDSGITVKFYESEGIGGYSTEGIITKEKPYVTMTITKDAVAAYILVYAGIDGHTAGNKVTITKAMLVPGTRSMPWTPSINKGWASAYVNPATNEPYYFKNTYVKGNPHEHIFEDENEKPTIKGIKNTSGQLFGAISAVGFDVDDNDELIASGDDGDAMKYQHSFFYIKLNQYDGDDGFNLFDRASQSDAMVIQMTSGACNGCKFKIQAVEKTDAAGYNYYENPVQTTSIGGDLVAGNYTEKIDKNNIQTWQQNTKTASIWICLQKDTETFGQIYPSQKGGIVPQAGDTFNIINIELPQRYVDAAEKRLAESGLAFMSNNNDEKFTFDIQVSRIYFAENPELLSVMDEYCKMRVEYNYKQYELFANSFRITAKDGEALPDIQIDLVDTISVGENFLTKIVNQAISLIPDNSKNFLSSALAENRYLNKQRSDRTPYSLAIGGELISENVARSREYLEGLTGLGWRVDADGNIYADSLSLRKFLEVPELRYNRTEVTVGIQWLAAGAGIVESYLHEGTTDAPQGDGTSEICNVGWITLKLEDGELGSLSVGDFCMGIWHYADGNETEDSDDNRGNFTFAGFRTLYFFVYGVEGARRERLHIRTRSKFPNEPVAGLHFAAYGNDRDTGRQKSAYMTRTYTRYLAGVNSWNWGTENIMMQMGDLSGLTINGVSMSGYSAYLNNIFFDGVIKQIESSPLRLSYEIYGDKYVGMDDDCVVRLSAFKGFDDVTGSVTWVVSSSTGAGVGTVSNLGYLTITKDVLAGRDEAEVTIQASWRKNENSPLLTATTKIVISDKSLLKGDPGSSYTINLLKGTRDWGRNDWNIANESSIDGEIMGLDALHTPSSQLIVETAWQNIDFEHGVIYTLSFWAKGSGYINTYCHAVGTDVQPVNGYIFAGGTGLNADTLSYNTIQAFVLTNEWKRHCVTFRVDGTPISGTTRLSFTLLGKGYEAWIAGAKIEIGANDNTAWSPAPEDMIGKDGTDGVNGKDAVTWEWEANPTIIHCDASGMPVDDTLDVKCYKVTGNNKTLIITEQDGTYLQQYRMEYRVQTDSGISQWNQTSGQISLSNLTAMDSNPKYHIRIVRKALTGEGNVMTEFYVGHVCDGAKGQKGDRGDKGDSIVGPMGAVIRVRGLFEPGEYYYDGTTPVTSTGGSTIRWLDVVWVVDSYDNRQYKQCVKTGTYTSQTGPKFNTSVNGWAEFSQLDNLIVQLLIAKNARIEFLNGQEIIFGDTQGVWGRIGVPVEDIVMWSGGEDTSVASYILDKFGKVRFGKSTGKHVVIDPGHTGQNASPAQITIRDAGGEKRMITIDGQAHTLESVYGVAENLNALALNGVYNANETSIDAGSVTILDNGGTLKAYITAILNAKSVEYTKQDSSGVPMQAMFVKGSATVTLGIYKNNTVVKQASTSVTSGTLSNPEVQKNEDIVVEVTGLLAGTYSVRASVSIVKESATDINNNVVTASASARILNSAIDFDAPKRYESFLCGNGLTVASSFRDFMRAVDTDSGFRTEMTSGKFGIMVSRQGLLAKDSNGSWDATVMTCEKKALDANYCVCEQLGARTFTTSSDTYNLPANTASRYGIIQAVTLNSSAGHHIQIFYSFTSPVHCWTRRCLSNTWESWKMNY